MGEHFLSTTILPLSLFLIMFGMGLSLTIDDFKRVLIYPKAVFIGLTNQLILLPIIGFGLTFLFDFSSAFLVGIMLLAACPGGTTSNLITHVSKGDTALSITLTAIASCITVFSIPFITQWSLNHFMEADQVVELPLLKTMAQIFIITIVPVSIGMLIRAKKTDFANRMDKPVRILASVIFVLLVTAIIIQKWDIIVANFYKIGAACLVLNIITMGLGYAAAKVFNLNIKQSVTIAIESGLQNSTLAFVVAYSILENDDIGAPAAIYGLIMFVTGGFIMWHFGRREEEVKSNKILFRQ